MTEQSSSLAALLKRLEVATSRLEDLSFNKQKEESKRGSKIESKVETKTVIPPYIQLFDSQILPLVENYLKASQAINIDEIVKHSLLVKELFDKQREFLVFSSQVKKPKSNQQEIFQKSLEPIQNTLNSILEFDDENRTSKFPSHLKAVSNGASAVGWVCVEPDTVDHVKNSLDSAQFYAVKVIRENKEKEPAHVEWANSFTNILKSLVQYVQENFKTGLTWNPNGEDAETALGNNASKSDSKVPIPPPKPSSLKSPPSGPGLPPPPPPPPVHVPSASEPNEVDMGDVFKSINQGSAITAGLKKVDPSQQTHKNPELRQANAVVPPAKSSARPSTRATQQPPAKEAKTFLDGAKWYVQHYQTGNVVIQPTELKQVVYIFNCNNTTVQIEGKCNAVVLDSCKKVGVVIETAMASTDIINCQSCQLQIRGTTPTIIIDKTDGLQVYLNQDCLGIEVLTAKSSQINLLLPQQEQDDYEERALPEQFKTTIVEGKIITVPVDHE